MLKQPLTDAVTVRFFMPSPALAPFISTYYLTEVNLPEGETVEDWLHPEWANLRFSHNDSWQAAIGDEPLRHCAKFVATGPTSHAAHFVAGTMRAWGIGLIPLGWARFVGAPAEASANRFSDGDTDPAFARFPALLDTPGPKQWKATITVTVPNNRRLVVRAIAVSNKGKILGAAASRGKKS